MSRGERVGMLAITIAAAGILVAAGFSVRHANGNPATGSVILWVAATLVFLLGVGVSLWGIGIHRRAAAPPAVVAPTDPPPAELWMERYVSDTGGGWTAGVRIHNDGNRLAALYAQMVSFDPGISVLEMADFNGPAPWWITGTNKEPKALQIPPHTNATLDIASGTAYIRMADGQWAWDGNRTTPISEFSFIVPGVAMVKYRGEPVSGVVKVWADGSDGVVFQFKIEIDLVEGNQSVDPRVTIKDRT